VIVGLVLCWLNSRGKFMFLHCVAGNKAEVKVPWQKFARHGNSLFLFRIVFGLIVLAIAGLPIAFAVFSMIGSIAMRSAGLTAAAVAELIATVFAVVVIAIVAAMIIKLTYDFVVPIMFLHTASCVQGWKQCLALIGANKARILLYLLFQIVISMVISFIIMAICIVGCCLCCASLLLLVPYVGTVILLPLFVFKRAYSLFYLRQFGPSFDVFSRQPA
jgi:hypothetical protein